MFDLTKIERSVIIFLLVSLLLGLGIIWYQKTRPCARVEVRNFEIEKMEQAIQTKGRINLNEATAEDLERLEGIGKSLAERIISFRDSKGRFNSIEELKGVKGIGDKLFGKIKDRISAE